jgi:hypothetical protein
MGTSAVAAAGLSLIAVANAVSPGISVRQSTSYFPPGTRLLPFITANAPRLQGRPLPRAGGQGYSVRLSSGPALGWVGTIMPAAIAVLLVLLIIFLHATRADRDPVDRLIADQ